MNILDIKNIRKDFPILSRKINGKPLVYLDNAATTQKPVQVIDTVKKFDEQYNANIHRAVHQLSAEATEIYERCRKKTAAFINCDSVIFTKNTTESINLVMRSMQFNKGDEIISTVMEHHSNIIPWQFLRKYGVIVKFLDICDNGTLNMSQFENLLTKRTKLVAVTHASNVLGTINPVKDICKISRDNESLTLIDAAQSVPHMSVNVKNIDCDFLAFSGHKMLGPMGVGVLYGKEDILEKMEPFNYGGDMIKEVTLEKSTWNNVPWKFEAGTPNASGVVGLSAAIDYLNKIGMKNIEHHEKKLTEYAMKKLSEKDIIIYGPLQRIGVISFKLGDVHSHDLASVLNDYGIAIRSGHHCAIPLMKRLGISDASRASFYIYNTMEEIDKLAESLEKARTVFRL